MTQDAIVTKLLDNCIAEISVKRKSACSSDCENCHGCAHPEEIVTVSALNTANAQIGDHVIVESPNKEILGIAALIYLFPVLLMFISYFIFDAKESIRILISFIGLVVGFVVCRLVSGKIKKQNKSMFIIKEVLR